MDRSAGMGRIPATEIVKKFANGLYLKCGRIRHKGAAGALRQMVRTFNMAGAQGKIVGRSKCFEVSGYGQVSHCKMALWSTGKVLL